MKFELSFVLLVVFCLLLIASNVSAGNILVLVAFPGKSHWMMFEHVIKELLNRGHHVTTITNFHLSAKYDNYTEILIDPKWDFDANLDMKHFFYKKPYESMFFKITSLWNFGLITTEHAFQTENVKNFIKNNNEHFDLIISEHFVQESMNMFAYKYKAPLVYLSTLDYDDVIDQSMGAVSMWSHLPHYLSDFNENMNFVERFLNIIYSLFGVVARRFDYLPKQYELATRAFAELGAKEGPLPSLTELEKNISVCLVNSHLVISHKRPKMPGLIDVAGLHIRPVKPLPENLQSFLDGATDGAIYFSLGSYMRSSETPPEKLEAILNTFKKLKMKILWKFEADNIKFPSNVMIQNWLPQNDILAHKNVKLFIAHGGVFGLQEALYHAVPMIIFPFYGDQHRNGRKMERYKVGKIVDMSELTEGSLTEAIKTFTSDKSYQENMDKLSDIFRNNIADPLESSVFWIEYVMKYKGAPHLRSAAVDLEWYQYLMLDVFGLMFLMIFLTIYIIWKFLRAIFKLLFARNGQGAKKFKSS